MIGIQGFIAWDALNISMHAVLLSAVSQEVSLVHCHGARATWSPIGFRKSGVCLFFFFLRELVV